MRSKAAKAAALKVAVFTDTYHPQVNGLVTSIDSNRQELGKRGHELTIYVPNIPGAPQETLVKLLGGFVFPPQPEYTFVLPWGVEFSLRGIPSDQYDVVHSHATWGAGFVARWAANRWKKPLVLTYHTMWELYAHYSPLAKIGIPLSWQMPFFKWVTRFLCNPCHTVIAPTESIRQQLLRYGVSAKIAVLPTGLTSDVYKMAGPVRCRAFRKKWNLNPKDFVISSAGRLGPEKNWPILLKAIAGSKKLAKVKLIVAGDGPERKNLEALVLKLGLQGRVQFTGYIPRTEVADMFEAADLFAFASVTETQGMVVLEAMARGLAVVAADALGPGEILKDQKSGWLCKADDADDMMLKLEEALSKPAIQKKKAAAAKRLAKDYSAKEINLKLENIYIEAVADYKAKHDH